MSPDLLLDGDAAAPVTVALAHGAGAPMDSPFMAAFAQGLAERGLRVARFEFPYMAGRRAAGSKRPPDRAPVLEAAWRAVIDHLGPGRLVIGGKSMGGRIASMVADDAGVRGLVCLGYPFHPPGRPEKTRVAHLETLRTPTLILQGTRDPLGNADEVPGYPLSPAIRVHWLADGDHGLKPRKASGRTEAGNWAEAMDAIAEFARRL
ncbi:MAG: alpha/beta fold hydrolase [Hyphomicrobiales bacterium]|nr:alpha/beta fold hydrolase [Hyphomicrobiales bacterium]MCP5372461.1 alpha/beta fold hydrolase [Hyphomicrobiales bacterium]